MGMQVLEVLMKLRKVAVVGLSDNSERDSYKVATFLQSKGFRIYPVNPSFTYWNGIKAFPNLASIPKSEGIEVIDIFRRSEAVPEIVKDSLPLKPKVIWMQEGVVSEEGKEIAEKAGISVIMDRCMMKEYKRSVGE